MIEPNENARLYRRRLQALKYFHRKLLVLHDPRGNWGLLFPPRGPHLRRDWEKMEQWMSETRADADAGLPVAVKWLAKTADLRREVEELRTKPLPPTDYARGFPSESRLRWWARTPANMARMHALHDDHDRHMAEVRVALAERMQEHKNRERQRSVSHALARIEGLQCVFEASRGVPKGHLTRHFDFYREKARADPSPWMSSKSPSVVIPWD